MNILNIILAYVGNCAITIYGKSTQIYTNIACTMFDFLNVSKQTQTQNYKTFLYRRGEIYIN